MFKKFQLEVKLMCLTTVVWKLINLNRYTQKVNKIKK